MNQIKRIHTFVLKSERQLKFQEKAADQYIHKLPKTPDSKAGAKDLAGFIDASDITIREQQYLV